MHRLNNIRNILFFLFVLYSAQGALYPQGSLVSQSALVVILLLSGFFFFRSLTLINNKNSFYKAWSALLLLNIVGFIFTATFTNSLHFGMLKSIIINFLSFYPFYYLARTGNLKSKHLVAFFLVMLPITIMQYFFNASQILSDRASGSTDLVNNISYSFVALIPFVFLFNRKRLLSIVSMVVLMFFIIQGAKRGALLAGTIGLLSFVYFQIRTIDKKNLLKGYLIVCLGVIGLVYFAYDTYQNNEFLVSRMERIDEVGGSSGRDRIYSSVFNGWYHSDSVVNILFGFGFAASLELSGGNFAHNDWLELLSNFGLVGFVMYLYLFYSTIKTMVTQKWYLQKRLVMITILMIWFFTTLISMSYTSGNGYIQAILLGYLLGSRGTTIT